MKFSPAQYEKTAQELGRIAGEPTQYSEIGGHLYIYGSELATLRLLKHYKLHKKTEQGYSKNLKTFFFAIDLNID